MEALFVM